MSDARTTRRASLGSEDRSSAGSVDDHIRSSPWRLHQDKTKTVPRHPASGSVSSSSGVQQQEEAAAEASRPSSSSLSPASRALEMADKRYEQELRARGAAGDGDSEDGSDDSIGPASQSTGRTSGVRSLSGPGDPGEGFRAKIGRRKNFVQERRGRNRTQGGSLLLRGSDSTPENSPASSRASSTDSWRQALARARGPNYPRKEDGAAGAGAACEGKVQADVASVPSSTGEDVDGMNVERLKARAVELGVPTSGRKPALPARIKEKMAADALAATNAAAVPVTAIHPARKSAEVTVVPPQETSETSAVGGRSADVDVEERYTTPVSMTPFENDVCSNAVAMAADGEGDRDAEGSPPALDDEAFVTAEGWIDVDMCEDDGNRAIDARTDDLNTPEAKGFPFEGGDVVERDIEGNGAAGTCGVDITPANVSRSACWQIGIGRPDGLGSSIDCVKFIDAAAHMQSKQQQCFDSTRENDHVVLSSIAASDVANDVTGKNVTDYLTSREGTNFEGVGAAADFRQGETVVSRSKVEVSTTPSTVAASDNEGGDGGDDGRPQVGQARADGGNASSRGRIESCSPNDTVNTPTWLSAAEAIAARFNAENATTGSHEPVDATVGRDADALPPPPPRSYEIYSLTCTPKCSVGVEGKEDQDNSKNGHAASQIGDEHGEKRDETAERDVANENNRGPDDPPQEAEADVDAVVTVVGTACPEDSVSMAVESRPTIGDGEVDPLERSSTIGRSDDDIGVGRTGENGTIAYDNSKATMLEDAAAGGSTAGRNGATPNRPVRVSESGSVGISTEVDQSFQPATGGACGEEKNGLEERVPSAAELTEKFMEVARLWAPMLMKASVSASAIRISPASRDRRSVSPPGRGRATRSSPTTTSPTGTKNRDSATSAVAPTSSFPVDLLKETLSAKIKAKTLTLWLQRGSGVPFSEICAVDGDLKLGSGDPSPSARRDSTASPVKNLGIWRSSFAGDASARARAAAGAARMLRARAAGGIVGRRSTARRLTGSVGGGSGRLTSKGSSKLSVGGTGVEGDGVTSASSAKGFGHKTLGIRGRLSVSPPRTKLAGSVSRLSSNSTSSAKAAAAAAVTGAGETRDGSGKGAARVSSVTGPTRAKCSSGVVRSSSVTGGTTDRNDVAAMASSRSSTCTNTKTPTKSADGYALARSRSAPTPGLVSGVSPTGTGVLTPESGTGTATPKPRAGICSSKTGSARTPPKRNPMFKGGVSPPRPPRGSVSRPGMAFTPPSAGGGEGVRGARRSAALSPRQGLGGAGEANAAAGGAVSASKLPVEGGIRVESLGTPARIARLRNNYPTLKSAGRTAPSGPKPSTDPASAPRPSSGARSGLFGTGSSPGMRGASATPPRSEGRNPARKGDALRVFCIETPSPLRGGTAARLLAGTNASADNAASGVSSTPLRPPTPGS